MRGLNDTHLDGQADNMRRTPHVRGLKSDYYVRKALLSGRTPHGAWIEIDEISDNDRVSLVAPRTGCVD